MKYTPLVEKPVYPENLFEVVDGQIEITMENAKRLAKWRIDVEGYIKELENIVDYYESFIKEEQKLE
jgi:hypothetical protein